MISLKNISKLTKYNLYTFEVKVVSQNSCVLTFRINYWASIIRIDWNFIFFVFATIQLPSWITFGISANPVTHHCPFSIAILVNDRVGIRNKTNPPTINFEYSKCTLKCWDVVYKKGFGLPST